MPATHTWIHNIILLLLAIPAMHKHSSHLSLQRDVTPLKVRALHYCIFLKSTMNIFEVYAAERLRIFVECGVFYSLHPSYLHLFETMSLQEFKYWIWKTA